MTFHTHFVQIIHHTYKDLNEIHAVKQQVIFLDDESIRALLDIVSIGSQQNNKNSSVKDHPTTTK